MKITVGRIVLYTLTLTDSEIINRRRTHGGAIAEALQASPPNWHRGAQAHVGEHANDGETLPLLVTGATLDNTVNGQVFLNGNDVLFVKNVMQGEEKGQWKWPPRLEAAGLEGNRAPFDHDHQKARDEALEADARHQQQSRDRGQPIGVAPVAPGSDINKEAVHNEQDRERTNN